MTDTDRKRKMYLYALFKKNGYPRSFVQSTLWNCEANQKKRKEGKSEEKKKKELQDMVVLSQMLVSKSKGCKLFFSFCASFWVNYACMYLCLAWCSEIGSLTSLDACISGTSRDVREQISLHLAVCV